MVKPDGVRRGLVGQIVSRLENKGLTLAAMRMMVIDPELASAHYREHRDKGFYGELIQFITSGPVVAMVWEGREAPSVVRLLMGATDPAKAEPGTIRGDLALDLSQNVVHGSDSQESAEREIALYFPSRDR
jgi:nucleoside-diphosphate kinase